MGSPVSRTRNWSLLLYPDDLKPNFQSLIESLNIPCCLSPVHDPDASNVNPEEQRKRHIHVFFAFDSVKTEEQVIQLMFSIFSGSHHGWTKPIPVNSPKAMVRYFIHADQPSKQQFKNRFLDITCFNGFILDNFLVPSSSEKSMYVDQMMNWIQENDVIELEDLFEFARAYCYDTWFYVLNNSSLAIMSKYIDSRRHRREGGNK